MQHRFFLPSRNTRQRRALLRGPARPLPPAASVSFSSRFSEKERQRVALEDRLMAIGLVFCLVVQVAVLLLA